MQMATAAVEPNSSRFAGRRASSRERISLFSANHQFQAGGARAIAQLFTQNSNTISRITLIKRKEDFCWPSRRESEFSVLRGCK